MNDEELTRVLAKCWTPEAIDAAVQGRVAQLSLEVKE